MSMSTTDILDALAEHVQIADHAYQQALAHGDLFKIKAALRFWKDCDHDYQVELKRVRRNRK